MDDLITALIQNVLTAFFRMRKFMLILINGKKPKLTNIPVEIFQDVKQTKVYKLNPW